MTERRRADSERAEEARRTLERVARESETAGTSSFARIGRRVGDHFAAREAQGATPEETDKAELWGRRIGRALSPIGFVVLVFWLGRQLGWW